MASTLTFDAPSDPMLQRRRAIQDTAAASLRRRKTYSKIAVGICWLFLGIAIIPLVAVVVYVVIKGLPAWNADFFTPLDDTRGHPRRRGGQRHRGHRRDRLHRHRGGGAPRALSCGLFLAESDGRVAAAVRFVADVMTGVPSITIGIFGYIAIVRNFGYSGLAGAFAIGIVMLPVIIRAGETAFRGVPRNLNEAALALGARHSTVARRVVVPTAMPGVITGTLLAIARGLGETAPLAADHLRQPVHAVEPDPAHERPAPGRLQQQQSALRR